MECKLRYLDLAQGLVLFVLIQLYLKSCCLPAPSVAAAISTDYSKCNRLLAMRALGIH